MEFTFKGRYHIGDLISIVRMLREPGGCPWDREQDHHSIRKNLIEETYEVAEAIDLEDAALLREELGDLLLQVVFHAQMETEAGRFSFDDVCDGICQKLIVRHPHVFGTAQVSSTGEVLKNWEEIKQQTKGQTTASQTLESVPKTLPALMRAAKVQQRAAKIKGFAYPDLAAAAADLKSETQEWEQALECGARAQQEQELGDLLFSAVNVARMLDVDPEQCLNASTEKFMRRFAKVESLCGQQGLKLADCPAGKLDTFWQQSKQEAQPGEQPGEPCE